MRENVMSEFNDNLKKLLADKEDLLDRFNRIKISKRKEHSTDSSDRAIERENDEVVDELGEKIIQELEQIDNAIYRIQKNIYNICTVCHKKIPKERLEALPYTNKCIECAE